MAEDKERLEFKKLPSVSDLETQLRKRVIETLEALDQIVIEKNKLAIQEDEMKDELERLQKESGKTGFRHGWLCFTAQAVAGRKTLDTMMLMEAGVPAATIQSCYKVGRPTTRVTFKHLDEEV
jgi:hypothetical protein